MCVCTSISLSCVAVCCSVLQWLCFQQPLHCVAVRCSELQHVAISNVVWLCVGQPLSSVAPWQSVAVNWSVLQCVAANWSVLPCVAECCSCAVCWRVMQCDAVCCSVLQCVAGCCRVLQCAALCVGIFQCSSVVASKRTAHMSTGHMPVFVFSAFHSDSIQDLNLQVFFSWPSPLIPNCCAPLPRKERGGAISLCESRCDPSAVYTAYISAVAQTPPPPLLRPFW